jgi:hypothetical protein
MSNDSFCAVVVGGIMVMSNRGDNVAEYQLELASDGGLYKYKFTLARFEHVLSLLQVYCAVLSGSLLRYEPGLCTIGRKLCTRIR